MSQKRSKKRRNANQETASTAQEQIGNAVENLLNGLESIRESVARAGRTCEQAYENDAALLSSAVNADSKRLEKYSQELSSLVNDATRLKELCELCMKIEDTSKLSQADIDVSATPKRSVRRNRAPSNTTSEASATPSAPKMDPSSRPSSSSSINSHPSTSTSPSVFTPSNSVPTTCTLNMNVDFFSRMLREYYESIRSGRIAIRADESVCATPIPRDVHDVVSRILAEHDVLVLLPLFETVLSEHVRKIRDSLIAIMHELERRGRCSKHSFSSGADALLLAPANVSLSHAYCFVKLYVDEYRALAAAARSVAQVLSDAYVDDSQLEKVFYLNWESMNKHMFYTLVYNDELVRDYVAVCVRKLQAARAHEPFNANRDLLAVIARCDPVTLCDIATTSTKLHTPVLPSVTQAKSNEATAEDNEQTASGSCELLIKCTATELLARHDRVQSELETARIKRFLLDALQQTQSAKAATSTKATSSNTHTGSVANASTTLNAICSSATTIPATNNVDPVLDRIQTLRDTFEQNRKLSAEAKANVGAMVQGTIIDATSKKRRKKKKKQRNGQRAEAEATDGLSNCEPLPNGQLQLVVGSHSSYGEAAQCQTLQTPACCIKCGSPHVIATTPAATATPTHATAVCATNGTQFNVRSHHPAHSHVHRHASGTEPQRSAVQNVTELLAKQSQLAQFIESIQSGKVHLCEHLQEEFEAQFGQLPPKNCHCHRPHAASGPSELPLPKHSTDALEMARRLLSISVPPAPPFRIGAPPDDDDDADAGDAESNSQTDDDDDARNPPVMAANAFSRSPELLDEPPFLSAAYDGENVNDRPLSDVAGACVLTGSWPGGSQDGPYYLLDTGNLVPLGQTAEQLDELCKAIFTPVWYAPANIVLPVQTSQPADSDVDAETPECASASASAASDSTPGRGSSVAGYPVVINGRLYMLVNGAECSSAASAVSVSVCGEEHEPAVLPLVPTSEPAGSTPTSAVNVVPVRLPDDIVQVLHSSLSSFNCTATPDASGTIPLRRASNDERPISMNVQRGVVFIDEPSLQLPTTDNSVDFHTKPAGGRITVPSTHKSLASAATHPRPVPMPDGHFHWEKPPTRTAVRFSDDEDDEPADDEQLDAEDDGTASAASHEDEDDEYEDGDEDGPLDLEHTAPSGTVATPGNWQPPKCNCQHCAFFGHPVSASGPRNQRALDSQERLRKKLAQKQRTAQPMHEHAADSSHRRTLAANPTTADSLEAIDAAERMTTKLFADFKKAVHDVVEKTVKQQHASASNADADAVADADADADPVQPHEAQSGRLEQLSLDELVRFIEGNSPDSKENAARPAPSSKSEKRKRKKEKSKADVSLPAAPSVPAADQLVSKQNDFIDPPQQHDASPKIEAQAASEQVETTKGKETKKQSKDSAKTREEKRKHQADVLPHKSMERDAKAPPGRTERERERKTNAGQLRQSAALTAESSSSARSTDQLVIPDFGEVPISLDSSKGNRNQHKPPSARTIDSGAVKEKEKDKGDKNGAGAKRSDKERAVRPPAAAAAAAAAPPVSTPSKTVTRPSDAFETRLFVDCNKPEAAAKHAAAARSHSSVSPSVAASSGSESFANSSKPTVHTQIADQRERKVNPRYRNGIKLEAFVRPSLRPNENPPAVNEVPSHVPTLPDNRPQPLQKNTQRNATNSSSFGRHPSESNVSTASNGTSGAPTVPQNAIRLPATAEPLRQPQRARTYQNANLTAAQTHARFGQTATPVTPNSRHRPRNFYGPQHAAAALVATNALEQPADGYDCAAGYHQRLETGSNAYQAAWDSEQPTFTYPSTGSASLDSSSGNPQTWEPAWLSSAPSPAQTALTWSSGDDRLPANGDNGEVLGSNFATYRLEADARSTPASSYTMDLPETAPYSFDERVLQPNGDDWNDVAQSRASFSPVASKTTDELLPRASSTLPFGHGANFPRAGDSCQLPPVYSSVWQLPCLAPTDSNVLNLKGSLFDAQPNASAAAQRSSNWFDSNASALCGVAAAADEQPLEADDDFDPEVEQFRQICMNEAASNSRERMRVQVNLSEIFKKKL